MHVCVCENRSQSCSLFSKPRSDIARRMSSLSLFVTSLQQMASEEYVHALALALTLAHTHIGQNCFYIPHSTSQCYNSGSTRPLHGMERATVANVMNIYLILSFHSLCLEYTGGHPFTCLLPLNKEAVSNELLGGGAHACMLR